MAGLSRTDLAFYDEGSASNYLCDTCHTLPKCTLRSQCCGAIYCQNCAESAESGAVLTARQRPENPSGVRMNLKKIVCIKCKRGNLQLLLDDVTQEKIDKLQVQCLKPCCGWIGDYAISNAHLKQPHVGEEIYDNVQDDEFYEDTTVQQEDEEYYVDTLAQAEPEQDIYDNQVETELYEDTLVQSEQDIYDNQEPDEMYEDTLAQSTQDIYDNDAQNEEDEMYVDPLEGESITTPVPQDYESYEFAAMGQEKKTDRDQASTDDSQQWMPPPPPQPIEPAKNTTKKKRLSVLAAEQGSLTSYDSKQTNPCLKLYKTTHSEYFSDLSTSEKVFYVAGFLTASLWLFFAIAMIIISLLSFIQKVINKDATASPQCGEYSSTLLWVVIAVHLIVIVYLAFWLVRGSCKRFRGRKMNRALLLILFLLTILYVLTVFGFSASVFAFVNNTRSIDSANVLDGSGIDASGSSGFDMANSTNASGMGIESGESSSEGSSVDCEESTMASGSGDMKFGNQTACNVTAEELVECVQVASGPFTLAIAFVGLLLIFIASLSCFLGYECSHNGLCYKRTIYDPTVTVFQKDTPL